METGAHGLDFSLAIKVVATDTGIGIDIATALHHMLEAETALGRQLMLKVDATRKFVQVLSLTCDVW